MICGPTPKFPRIGPATPAETAYFFPAPVGTGQAFKVENLSPNTPFLFAVRALDMAGTVIAAPDLGCGQADCP
jgi:hypothetical protein